MTATHPELDALLAACDLSDETERLMLADAYALAGRDADAAALRNDDRGQLADRPYFVTNVRQVTGHTEPDESGRTLTYEREKLVETDFSHHVNGHWRHEWEALHPADRLWWHETLGGVHNAAVALADAAPEVREYVEGRLDADCELEYWAAHVRGLIAEALAGG